VKRDEGNEIVGKKFNVSADCKPQLHYMVDLSERLEKIKTMIDAGEYFTVNRARQYGKTTTLKALERFLENEYLVVAIDFQMVSYSDFEKEELFVEAFSREVLDAAEGKEEIPQEIRDGLALLADGKSERRTLSGLFRYLSKWCGQSVKKLVLIIDEVDSASNNQVFLDLLAQLRGYYINRDRKPTFQSVILAGVYDVKNLKRKMAADGEEKMNSPWNIAADFLIDMSFSVKDIEGMLFDYENDNRTGMSIRKMAQMLYDYTDGYPFLVSRLCKLIDEHVAGDAVFPDKSSAWTKEGMLEAVNILLHEKNTLFDSLIGKIDAYMELREMIHALLFRGQSILYNPDDGITELAMMFGFVKIEDGNVRVANRIFETRLYNYFLTTARVQGSDMYKAATLDKNQFVENGHLNMRLVLEKFVRHFDDLYGDQNQEFYEEDGRRYFLLYLRPIINGRGNYYIEAQTRNRERTDVIVDYGGEQIVVELKLWHGNAYNLRGEAQLLDYLEYYHLDKGYMLSFNFNKHKEIGIKEITINSKTLIEAVV
jgi:hypothetical protein